MGDEGWLRLQVSRSSPDGKRRASEGAGEAWSHVVTALLQDQVGGPAAAVFNPKAR